MLKITKDGKKIAVLKDDASEPELVVEPKKTAREMAKELDIEVDKEKGQERVDFETGKRSSDE